MAEKNLPILSLRRSNTRGQFVTQFPLIRLSVDSHELHTNVTIPDKKNIREVTCNHLSLHVKDINFFVVYSYKS